LIDARKAFIVIANTIAKQVAKADSFGREFVQFFSAKPLALAA